MHTARAYRSNATYPCSVIKLQQTIGVIFLDQNVGESMVILDEFILFYLCGSCSLRNVVFQ